MIEILTAKNFFKTSFYYLPYVYWHFTFSLVTNFMFDIQQYHSMKGVKAITSKPHHFKLLLLLHHAVV